ncbi:MAG: glutaredoxin family protein [Marinagarivorans sp.]|nr:glutaredoxin family protein [Marinagarivorans sp.]
MALQWILYGTLGCHLCEQAEAIIARLQADFPIELRIVDVANAVDREAWVLAIGERIPVLENTATGAQLDWPFCPEAITDWLSKPLG